MSFEYYGGFIAHDLIIKSGGSKELAEAVAEAIIRHQDFIEDGMITTVGQAIQLSTMLGISQMRLADLDNMGAHPELIHPKVIEEVSNKYPRNKWTGCFANVVKDEIKLKPWAHTTAMGPSEDAIVSGILANPVMKKYD